MALVYGTNCGLITTRPTVDPLESGVTIDGYTRAMKVIPSSNISITEMGVWIDTASEAATMEIGIYTHDSGNDRPDSLISKESFAKGTTAGWKYVAMNPTIELTNGVTYWIAVQCDNVATTTRTNYAGSSYATRRYSAQTELTSTLGVPSGSTTSMKAIYALYTEAAAGTNFKINVDDAWKEVSAIKINVDDAWKEVTSAKVNVDDSWKEVF